jgi:integrase
MPIRWDTRNKRWRYEFDRLLEGRRHRLSRLLPKGWSQAKADAYDLKESGRLYAVASGIERPERLIDDAVVAYLRDKTALKSYKATAQHLAAIAWAYTGKPMSALPAVAREVSASADTAPATVRNRLACLKAAARWGWKKHGMSDTDPTARMQLPVVRNERQVYIDRKQMLRVCRACDHWQTQIAIRVAFYAGLRLGELYTVETDGGALVLHDTKNSDRRAIPAHPKVRHLLRHLPLTAPKITIQRAWQRARSQVGLEHVHFHDLRHSAASEMANAGVDLYTVGRVLGHRDARSTQRYAHLTPDTLAAAVGKIGKKRA